MSSLVPGLVFITSGLEADCVEVVLFVCAIGWDRGVSQRQHHRDLVEPGRCGSVEVGSSA